LACNKCKIRFSLNPNGAIPGWDNELSRAVANNNKQNGIISDLFVDIDFLVPLSNYYYDFLNSLLVHLDRSSTYKGKVALDLGFNSSLKFK
jgi:hypothetical protein